MSPIQSIREIAGSRLGKGVLLFSARTSNSILGMLFALIAGRLLTIEDHGVFASALARIVIVQAILEAGLQYSLVRFLTPAIRSGDTVTVANLLRASLYIKTVLLVSLGGLIALASASLAFGGIPAVSTGNSYSMLWLIYLGGAGMSFISYLEAIFVAHDSFARLSLWIPQTGIFRLILFAFYFWRVDYLRPEHVVFSYALGAMLSSLTFFFLFPPNFFLAVKHTTNWRINLRSLISYNSFVVAASFFSIFADWMEVLLLGQSKDTAIYNAARMPLQGFLILLSTMQSMFLPTFSGLVTLDEYRGALAKIYKLLLPACLLLIPGLLVLAWFVPFWFGPEYDRSVTVLYFLYPSSLLKLLFAPLGTALFALDRPKLIAAEAGLRMLASIVLNFFLIGRLGVNGAAIASFIAPFAGWALLIYCYGKFFQSGVFPFPEGRGEEKNEGKA